MLLVQPYCSYLTAVGTKWRGPDYDARFYALMLKDDAEKLAAVKNASANLPLGLNGQKEWVNKDAGGKARIRQHFGGWAARTIQAWGYDAATIVPIPNSDVTEDVENFRTLRIAKAVATRMGLGNPSTAEPAIYFREVMAQSHKGGTRNEDTLAANMVVRPGLGAQRVVLVDDMTTTGAHLKAARRVLAAAGIEVTHAVVGSRRMDEMPNDPFALAAEDLDMQAALDFGFVEEIDWPEL